MVLYIEMKKESCHCGLFNCQ